MRCARCNRELRRPPVLVAGMRLGPTCAALVAGAKPRRPRAAVRSAPDANQSDLFEVYA